MSALSELLKVAREYGPEAARALVRSGAKSVEELRNALATAGITLTQSGNPAGKAILQGLGQGSTASQVTRESRRPLVQALGTQERLRQGARNLPPPAPRPQFQVRERGGDIVAQPRVGPQRQIAPGYEPVTRAGMSSDPYSGLPIRQTRVVDVTDLDRRALPYMQPIRPEGFMPPGAVTRQSSLLPEGPGSGIAKLRYAAGVPDVNPMTGRRMGGQVYNPDLSGPSTPLPSNTTGLQRTAGLVGEYPSRSLDITPGQMSIEGLGRTTPTGPLSRQLAMTDPGTYQSVSDIAQRASAATGRAITPEDLLGPQGNRILGEYGALVPTGRPIGPRRQIAGVDLPGGVRTGYSSDPVGLASQRYAAPSLARRNNALFQSATDLRVPRLGLPNAKASLGVALGGATAGGIAYALMQDPQTGEEVAVPVDRYTGAPLDMGGTDMSPAPGGKLPLGQPPEAPILPGPGGSATGGVAGQTAPTVIRISDAASNQRQATQNALAAATYAPDRNVGQIADYYRSRQAYVEQPGVKGNIAEQLAGIDPRYGDPNSGLAQWANANPALAYELLQKSAPRGVSQQMPTNQGASIQTELGSNTANSASFNPAEAARVSIDQAPSDLRDATTPSLRVKLDRVPLPQEIRARQDMSGAIPFNYTPGFSAVGVPTTVNLNGYGRV